MHAVTWYLLSFISSNAQQATKTTVDVLNIPAVSRNASELVQEIHYDKIFIKFDPECLQHSDIDLASHFKQAISEKQRQAGGGKQDTKNGSVFASLNKSNSTSLNKTPGGDKGGGDLELQDVSNAVAPHLPKPDIFENILKTHLNDAKVVVGSSFMHPKIHDNGIIENPLTTQVATHGRRLGSLPRTTREDEILSAFHLLAATSLVGEDHIAELVALERKGKFEDAVTLIKKVNRLNLDPQKLDKAIDRLGERHKTRKAKKLQYIRNLTKRLVANNVTAAGGQNRTISQEETKDLMNEASWMGTEAFSVVTDAERLYTLDVSIIDNPFLEHHLLGMAHILPCIAIDPEPDRTKDTVDVIKPFDQLKVKSRRFLQAAPASSSSAAPETSAASPATEDETTSSASQQTSEAYLPVQLEAETNHVSSGTEFHSNNKTDFFGLFKKQQKSGAASNAEYYLAVPNDVSFDAQWYLRGEAQSEKYGAQIIDGWSAMLRDLYVNKTNTKNTDPSTLVKLDFADLKNVSYGMTVAVLDSGCSRNPDLVNQFWRNPSDSTCKKGVFVGTGDDMDSSGVSGDCVGYDFGNNEPDPTQEITEKIHGSSTSGLIAAEGNNGLGITGVCPQCKVMCIKIYDTEKQKITMSSVVRALDYIAEKKVKLSNHSYGGFGESAIELAAHKTLEKLGHLTICSAGNNGCNIDQDTSDPNACVDDNGNYPGPFTPASYTLDSVLSIGGTDREGARAWFSNYGKQSVDVYAPGQEIVTLYGESKLATVQGTSFSAPIVTGMAAVLWSYRPELTALEVKNILMTTGNINSELEGTAQEARIVSLSKALGTSQAVKLTSVAYAHYNRALMLTSVMLLMTTLIL